jgi:hypothetical protein
MRRYWKWLAPISCGGVTLGWLQAFGMFYPSNLLTDFLAYLFSLLISTLLGIPLEPYFAGGGFV